MASSVRHALISLSKTSWLVRKVASTNTQHVCRYHRHLPGVYHELYKRRLEQGPEPERARSEWSNWNYNAEIFAFGKRLGEDFNDDTLKRAFTHKSYISKEAARRQELGVEESSMQLELQDNTALAQSGEAVASSYIKAYLRHSLPNLPEEGVCGVTEYLLSDKTLAYLARNLGVTDLVLCEEFPVNESSLSTCFKAVIGGLVEDQGRERAEAFVLDLVITHLVGKTLDEIWSVPDPMGLLAGMMRKLNRGEPEPRLIWEAGSETMVAAYMIGIYSDKELLGKAAGETVTIAEEMAARDCLRQYFGLHASRTPFKFGAEGQKLALDTSKINPSLQDITTAALPAS